MPHVTEDAIRTLAAKLWEDDGRPTGKDLEYWLKAETELAKEPAAPVAEAPAETPATETAAEAPAKPKRKAPAKPRATKPKAAPTK